MIYKKEVIDMSLVQCPYEEDRGYIYITDDYTNNILKLAGYIDDEIDFRHLCETRVLENHISEYTVKSASNAYYYTRYVHKDRLELAEKTIATNVYYSYNYAFYVLEGRFELGEPIIATDANYSYWYAKYVLKGRFELGEAAITLANKKVKSEYFQLTGVQL